jgi:heat shock protein HtpX
MSDKLPPPVLSYDRAARNRRAASFLIYLFALALTPYFAFAALYFGEGWIIMVGGSLLSGLSGFDIFSLFQTPGAALIMIIAAVIIALGLGLLITWLLYRRAAGRVLRLAGAAPVSREQEKDLCRLVENLCIGSGLRQPALYVVETPAANALTLGLSPDQASLVVTRGLLGLLERRELEGVIAHELSQIGNNEIKRNTVLAAFLETVWLPYRIFSRLFAFLFRMDRLIGAGCLTLFLVFVGGALLSYLSAFWLVGTLSAELGIHQAWFYLWWFLPGYCLLLVPLLGLMLQRAALRQMTFRSDADAALLTRNPEALARALEKLGAGRNAALPASQATAHLYAVDPRPGRSWWLSGILNVHPPLAERVSLLARMSPGASLEKLREAAQAGVRFGAAAGLPPEEPAAPALARLAVRPKSLLAHVPPWSKLVQEFTISEGETCLTELEINPPQYRGAWTLGLERWEVFGDPGWLGLTREYYLEAKGEIQGRAHQRGFLSATHVVRFGDQTYTLEKESVFLRQFTLRAGGRALGAIYPEGPVTKNVVAELPAATPLPLRIFLISLTLLWWCGRTAGTRR